MIYISSFNPVLNSIYLFVEYRKLPKNKLKWRVLNDSVFKKSNVHNLLTIRGYFFTKVDYNFLGLVQSIFT